MASDSAVAPAQNGISEDEAALYDRQIRLWGVEAQNKMRTASVLIYTMRGLSAEIAKNIVLAGVGTVTLLDGEDVSEEDLGANFFLREDDVGKKRVEAAAPRVQNLNPRVDVKTATDASLLYDDAFLSKFDLVVITEVDAPTVLKVNEKTRSLNKKLFACSSIGLDGWIFTDLLEHECLVDKTKTVAGETVKVPTRCTLSYVPFSKALEHNWKGATPRVMKRIAPGLWNVLTLFATQIAFPSEPITEMNLATTASQLLPKLSANTSAVTAEAMTRIAATSTFEFPPTAAIVGGLVGQDVLNVVGGKEEPVRNLMVSVEPFFKLAPTLRSTIAPYPKLSSLHSDADSIITLARSAAANEVPPRKLLIREHKRGKKLELACSEGKRCLSRLRKSDSGKSEENHICEFRLRAERYTPSAPEAGSSRSSTPTSISKFIITIANTLHNPLSHPVPDHLIPPPPSRKQRRARRCSTSVTVSPRPPSPSPSTPEPSEDNFFVIPLVKLRKSNAKRPRTLDLSIEDEYQVWAKELGSELPFWKEGIKEFRKAWGWVDFDALRAGKKLVIPWRPAKKAKVGIGESPLVHASQTTPHEGVSVEPEGAQQRINERQEAQKEKEWEATLGLLALFGQAEQEVSAFEERRGSPTPVVEDSDDILMVCRPISVKSEIHSQNWLLEEPALETPSLSPPASDDSELSTPLKTPRTSSISYSSEIVYHPSNIPYSSPPRNSPVKGLKSLPTKPFPPTFGGDADSRSRRKSSQVNKSTSGHNSNRDLKLGKITYDGEEGEVVESEVLQQRGKAKRLRKLLFSGGEKRWDGSFSLAALEARIAYLESLSPPTYLNINLALTSLLTHRPHLSALPSLTCQPQLCPPAIASPATREILANLYQHELSDAEIVGLEPLNPDFSEYVELLSKVKELNQLVRLEDWDAEVRRRRKRRI